MKESPPSHDPLDDLLDNTGNVRGLSFTPESTTRTHALSIKMGTRGTDLAVRTLTLKERNFDEVFESAVREVAALRGVTSEPLIRQLLDTREAFMKYYGLSYQHVKIEYTTVQYSRASADRARSIKKRISRH